MADADDLRERLRGLSRANQPTLESELQARVVARLRADGPAIVRRSRRRRAWMTSSLAALPLLIVAGWLGLHRAATSDTSTALAPQPSAKPAQCAALARPETHFADLSDGRRLLDLGARGRIALEAGGVAELVSSSPCQLELRLAQGRVSVHAANLFGGELRVRAGATDVVVHGTRFAVERAGDGVTVDVDEGAVGIEHNGRASAALVRGGQRLRLANTQAPVMLALTDELRVQLRAALAVEPVAPAPQPEAALPSAPSAAPAVIQPRRKPVRSSTATAALGGVAAAARPRLGRAPAAPRAPHEQAVSTAPAAAEPAPPAPAAAPASPAPAAAPVLPSPAAAQAPPAVAAAPVRRAEQTPQPTAAQAPRKPTAAELVARADTLWLSGARDAARDRYREAGAASGPTAQAAWLALARRELSVERTDATREALASYAARFPNGELRDEAAGIAFRAALADDDEELARRLAHDLVAHHPGTPPARAAARWLSERGVPP